MSEGTPLAVRYQRLVLLNRMSAALFGDKPFLQALPEACHAAMALMEAQSVAVWFVDELGRSSLAHAHRDKRLSDDAAKAEEAALLARAFASMSLVKSSAGGRSWEGAPLMRLTAEKAVMTGGVVFGHVKEMPLDEEREGGLVEIARHLRNARLIQSTLQQQKVFVETFDQSADALVISDPHAGVLRWNDSATELFGWTREEMAGNSLTRLLPPGREHEAGDLQARVAKEGRVRGFETERKTKDGRVIGVEVTLTGLEDEGVRFGALIAYRDITKRKEVERMKTEFVSLVSHELRTPMTAIRGFAETIFELWDELTAEQRRHYLQIILDESKRLGSMVNDFLDITRIEAGGIETAKADVAARALFERVARLFKEHPSKARFALAVGAETVRGDEEQLYRLLVNLSGNALKYSPEGGVVTLASEKRDGGVELSVADQGPGIAKKDMGRLFEKFFRAGDAVTKKTAGTGLGLAICKGIAEAHGGSMRVESEPGKGARFIAFLPD